MDNERLFYIICQAIQHANDKIGKDSQYSHSIEDEEIKRIIAKLAEKNQGHLQTPQQVNEVDCGSLKAAAPTEASPVPGSRQIIENARQLMQTLEAINSLRGQSRNPKTANHDAQIEPIGPCGASVQYRSIHLPANKFTGGDHAQKRLVFEIRL